MYPLLSRSAVCVCVCVCVCVSIYLRMYLSSGKNSDFFHTHKGMKQTHKGMKNHCFSRKNMFHTLKHHFITFSVCFIPWAHFSYLGHIFHTLCCLSYLVHLFHTLNSYQNYSISYLLLVFFIPWELPFHTYCSRFHTRERECCLLVLNLVSSTLPCIRNRFIHTQIEPFITLDGNSQ